LVDAATSGASVVELAQVDAFQAGRYVSVRGAWLPACVQVEPVESGADVRVGAQAVFGVA
jgi:hypothetical protein